MYIQNREVICENILQLISTRNGPIHGPSSGFMNTRKFPPFKSANQLLIANPGTVPTNVKPRLCLQHTNNINMAGKWTKLCIIRDCEATSRGSLHRIPWRDNNRRYKWLEYMKTRGTRGLPTLSSVICHAHFAGGDAAGETVPCILNDVSICQSVHSLFNQ